MIDDELNEPQVDIKYCFVEICKILLNFVDAKGLQPL